MLIHASDDRHFGENLVIGHQLVKRRHSRAPSYLIRPASGIRPTILGETVQWAHITESRAAIQVMTVGLVSKSPAT